MNAAYDVIVVGAGAAGLVAAAEAASRGLKTLLIEKNRRPGVKILMSGGTRCNLTQSTDKWGIIRAYGVQGNFLHSALAAFSPADLVKLIEDEGVPTKVEDTGKIFPVSNRATDVLEALLKQFHRSGAELATAEAVQQLTRQDDGRFALTTDHRALLTNKLIITVGGKSYPGSGTTGDGYAWAASLGHTIVPPRPALVPLTTSEPWVRDLSGITIPDTAAELFADNQMQPLDRRRGSLLFTHFGLSGPVILDISRSYTGLQNISGAKLACDFLPEVTTEKIDAELRQSSAADGKRLIANLLGDRLPKRLLESRLASAGLNPETRAAEFSKAGRAALAHAIKHAEIPITGTRGFAKAEVTAGGVSLNEIDSRSMQSKLVPSLYFAGEILDLDGPIGGYNFQAAFSTGVLAGRSV